MVSMGWIMLPSPCMIMDLLDLSMFNICSREVDLTYRSGYVCVIILLHPESALYEGVNKRIEVP